MSVENPKIQGLEIRKCPNCGAEAKPRRIYCLECGTSLPEGHTTEKELIQKVEKLGDAKIDGLIVELNTYDEELTKQNKLLKETPKRKFLKRNTIEKEIKSINENILRIKEEMEKSPKPTVKKEKPARRFEILKPLVPDPKEEDSQSGNFRDKFRTVKVLDSEKKLVCPKCGENFTPGSRRFCPKDGRRLVEEKSEIKEPDLLTPAIEEEVDLLENIIVGSTVSYQGENYAVKEIPSEENKYKYILVHPAGKPIYKLTEEQLSNTLKSGEAKLVLFEEENNEEAARLQEIKELKTEEAELREAIENLRKQILTLPDDEPKEQQQEEKVPEQIRKEGETFSNKEVSDTIISLLKPVGVISEIKNVKVEGNGKELNLDITVKCFGFDINVQAVLENEGLTIGLQKHKVNANRLVKGKAEKTIAPYLNQVSVKVREYIEQQKGKKVEKIWIEDGQLKVTFENK